MELWCLKNSVREFSVLNENLLGSPEAFWRPCVNLSLFIGEDGLEEGHSFLGEAPIIKNRCLFIRLNMVLYCLGFWLPRSLSPWRGTCLLPWIVVGEIIIPPALGSWLSHHLFCHILSNGLTYQLLLVPGELGEQELGRLLFTSSPCPVLNVN